jgi:hypothetical protein
MRRISAYWIMFSYIDFQIEPWCQGRSEFGLSFAPQKGREFLPRVSTHTRKDNCEALSWANGFCPGGTG